MAIRAMSYACISIFSFVCIFVTTIQLAYRLSNQGIGPVHYRLWKEAEARWDPQAVNGTQDKIDAVYVSLLYRFLWDLSLVLLFVIQHSFMAWQGWKNLMDDIGLHVIQRSLYVFAAAMCLQLLMQNWVVLPASPLWVIDTSSRPFLWLFFGLVHLLMWGLIYGAALTMDLPELVGIKQVYYHIKGLNSPMSYKSKQAQLLYRGMRHPGTACFLVILWLHPVMTLERWILATVWTIYLLAGFTVTEYDYSYVETQRKRKLIEIETQEVYEYHYD